MLVCQDGLSVLRPRDYRESGVDELPSRAEWQPPKLQVAGSKPVERAIFEPLWRVAWAEEQGKQAPAAARDRWGSLHQ